MLQPLTDHIQQFVKLNENDIKLLGQLTAPEEVKNKGFLLKSGQLCRHKYFVVKGCLRSYFISSKGTEQIVNFSIENWWATDYDSFVNQTASTLYIQAIENTTLLKISKGGFKQVVDQSPNIERYFRIIQEKVRIADQRRIQYIFNLTGEEHYTLFKDKNPQFVQRVPQYMIASYLGFTPEFLSKIRGKKK